VATLLAVLCEPQTPGQAQVRKPNIVIILGDDLVLGHGMFGSEFKTPNLDSLAKDGVHSPVLHARDLFTDEVDAAVRVDTHVNGLGNMDEWAAPNQMGMPGYEGDLNDRVASFPSC